MTEMDKSSQVLRVLSGQASRAEEAALSEMMAKDHLLKEEYEDMKLFYSFKDAGDPPPPGPFERVKELYRKRKRKKKLARSVLGCMCVLALLVAVLLSSLSEETSDLVFVNETLGSVINTLELKYKIEIEVDDNALLACRFTGSFLRVSSIGEVLPSIVTATNARTQFTKGKIVITGGTCL